MPVVETLYQPTLKDLVSGVRQTRFAATFAVTSAASTVVLCTATFTTPPDTARWLTGFSCGLTPGAGQNIVGAQLLNGIAGTLNFAAEQSPPIRTAAVPQFLYLPLDFLSLPGEVLTLQGVFDAGGVANAISGFVWGYDIPRANLSA